MSNPPPPHDLSHRLCVIPNLSVRGHSSHGRLRIRFDADNFLTWRDTWGNNVFFTRLEYRKLRVGVQHEFILLRGLSRKSRPNNPGNLRSEASTQIAQRVPVTGHTKGGLSRFRNIPVSSSRARPSDAGTPPWWTAIPDDVHHFVLKFEREANPNTQLNALVETEAFDYVDFTEFFELDTHERNSATELTITFPQAIAVEEVIKISASISQHQRAQLYTLRQFNCFFYSWTIITALLRLHVDWAPALQSNSDMTVQLITAKLVDLSDPQRTRFQPRQYRSKPGPEARPNLALLIAGEYDCAGIPDASQRPFIRLCHGKIRYLKTFQQILDSLQSPSRQPSLWVRNDLETVRDHVRKLLDTIADSTIGLATEGTGELTIDSLFWGDTHIKDLPPEWEDPIAKQVSALLDVYVDKMWSTFSEALKQINEANQNGQSEQSITRSRRSMALQRVRTSPLVLGTRLTPLGLRAAWNAARVRASLDLDESPLMPLIRMMRTMRDVPNQILNVSTIARDFLAVLAMKREGVRDEIRRARGNGEQVQASTTPNLSLDLGRSTVLGMMSDIDLRRPELEDQVVCELEKAIKKLALRRPKCSMYQLRRATLEMLIRLKETGKSINFGLQQESTWRICLWYSLGEEIVKVLEEAAESISNKRIHCWLRTSESEIRGEERPMLISDIHDFIRGRIKDLSVMLHNQGGPGATEYCRKEIEEAMDNIWKRMLEEDKRTETQINRKDRH